MVKVGNFLRSFSAFHISLFPLEPNELCAGLWAQAAPATPARAQWHQWYHSSVTLELSGTELVVTVTCPQCNAAFCSSKEWLVPKTAKYLQLPLNSWTWETTHENFIRETKPPEEKQLRFAYLLTDVLQGNTVGFLQVERCVYTNAEQAADPCNHN